MGAMASKKASASVPVSAAMAAPSAEEVRGPVAMIQCPSAGSAVISCGETLMRGCTIGSEAGLRYVYAGNRPGRVADWENTRCPGCRAVVRGGWLGWLIAAQLVVNVAVMSTKGSKSFRLWMPLLPFLALAGGALIWGAMRAASFSGS